MGSDRFYFMPFPYLLFGPVFFGLEYLLTQKHVLDGRTIGIANMFIINELVTFAGYVAVRRWLAAEEKAA